jgi:molybdopterin molybdotransferase
MDGFAVIAADVAHAGPGSPVTLDVAADIPAGTAPQIRLQSGQAARIMTGAPVPAGADAVVRVEDTDVSPRQAGLQAPDQVKIFFPAPQGENVRPAGQDVQRGELVMEAGQRIRPQDAGFLSMLGVSQAWVHRRPRVAVFSSGDELLPAGQPLAPGKIYDANSYTLVGLIEQTGAQAIHLGISADHPVAVRSTLEAALAQDADLIVSSAGVSVGALDFVRSVVEENGTLDFWRVNMRPGKPVAFGSYRGKPFIGLPGNPVSAFVGFEVFVRPALQKMLGMNPQPRQSFFAHLEQAVNSDGRESYLRSIVEQRDGELFARLTGHQGSGNLRSLVQANSLLFIPSGVKYLPSGSRVQVLLLDPF